MTDTNTGAPRTPTPSAADLMREQRLQRNLKILVIGMGLLILAGLGAVAFRIIQVANKPPATGLATSGTATAAAPAGELALELPRGAKVVSISLSGDRLAVHHESPAGTGITILDLATGRRLLDVKPLEAMPKN